jgi:GntR family transcriptional regulator/MocR family aminotransferase
MVKKSRNFVLATISLDRSSDRLLHLQVYQELRDAIVSKRFRGGARLPSTRTLAQELSISRNTIISAYDQLVAEGYLECRIGSGTYVTDALPDDILWLNSEHKQAPPRTRGSDAISNRGRQLAGFAPFFAPVTPKPFRHGLPALDEFPLELWIRLTTRRLRHLPRQLLGYGDPLGHRPLREAIASYLSHSRAVRCETDRIIIVAGSQQAIYLTAQVLLDPEDSVWIEDPGYLGARGALMAAESHLVPVPVDEQGLIVSRGVQLGNAAKLIYVTPSNQYPSTVTMSLTRRHELLEWSARSGAWIVEDDYDSEFHYKNRPVASLQGLDKYDRVIYVGTFSKLLAPTLRIGYIVLPPGLIDVFSSTSSLITRHPPTLQQAVLADFIEQGHLARHIRRMRALYLERRNELVAACKRELDGLVEITPPDAGTHLIAWLPRGMDDRAAARAAADQAVETKPYSDYRIRSTHRGGLVLGYGAFGKKDIRAGIQRLARALENVRKGLVRQ